jgi:hypothetical protein
MTDTLLTWRRITRLDAIPDDIVDDSVQSVFLSKVFHYSVGRNAWWGSLSFTYPGDQAFELDEAILKKRIENRRTQGSQFTLKQLPALALMGKKYDLILFQTWGSAPFKRIPRSAISGLSMFEIARSICKNEQLINTFLAPRGLARLPTLPFKTFGSRPQGSSYSLAWDEQRERYDLASVMALVLDVTLHLSNEGQQ